MPDFNPGIVSHSSEQPGSVNVSGSDAPHRSIIVRGFQDGVGSFYDRATGTGTGFSI